MCRVVLAVVPLACLVACQPRAQQIDGLLEADVAVLKGISATWAQSWLDCDIDAAAALYAEDGVRINPAEGPALQGREAIHASLHEDEGWA